MVSMMKLSKCRLCLKLGEFYSIFTYDNDLQLSDMAMACTKLKIFEGDGLPDKICGECLGKLSSAYIFKQQCERADAELRKSMPSLPQPDSSPGVRCNSDSGFSNRTDNSSLKNSKEKNDLPAENSRGGKDAIGRSRKRKAIDPEPGGMNILLKEAYSLNMGNPMEYEGIPKKNKIEPSNFNSEEDSIGDVSGMSDGDFEDDVAMFKCDICQAMFTNIKELNLHKTLHKKELKKTMAVFDGSGTETDNTQDSYASDGKSLVCRFCRKTFKLKIMLKRHMESCKKTTSYPSPQPSPSSVQTQPQKPPMRLIYASDLKCSVCGQQFHKRVRLRRHMRKFHNASPPPMTIVESSTNSRVDVNQDATIGVCPGCPKTFTTIDDASSHIKTCTGVMTIDRIMCKLCNCPAFSDLRTFMVHLKEKHVKLVMKPSVVKTDSELQCRMCGESFQEQDSLVKHLAAHMAKMDANEAESSIRDNMNILECTLCFRSFRDKAYLDKHIQTQHTASSQKRISDSGRQELKCDHCDKTFFYRQSLLTHRALKHGISNEVPVPDTASPSVDSAKVMYEDSRHDAPIMTIEECPAKCLICNKSGTVREMKGHNAVHTTINVKASNEYTCLGCGLTFSSLKVMRLHFREHRDQMIVSAPGPPTDVDPANFCEVVVANVKLEPEDSGYENVNSSTVQDHNDTPNRESLVSTPVVNLGGFTCPTCGKTMETMSSLRHHIRWHSSRGHQYEKNLICTICNENFKYNKHYRDHIKTHARDTNLDPKFRTCNICNRVSVHMRAHEMHLKWHKQSRFSAGEITCPICKKVLPNSRSFKYHMRCHQKKGDVMKGLDKLDSLEGAEENKCGYCGKVMANATSLKHHLSWHNSKSAIFMQRHECVECNKWFSNKKRYELHMRSHINSDMPFKCDVCFKGFGTEAARDGHVKRHIVNIWKTNDNMKEKLKKIRENNVACPVCGKVYPNQLKLLGHLKLVHPQSKMVKKIDPGADPAIKHTCTKCGKVFPNLRRYNFHLERHKTTVNFIKCKLCGKNSYSRKFHNIHIKGHLTQRHRENPLKCPHCDEQFVVGYDLHHHLRDVHEIVEDYIADRNTHSDKDVELEELQCPICMKVLASRGNFERHVDYHNSLTCNYCFERFKKMEFLEAHVNLNCDRKKVLGNVDTFEKKLKCEVCFKAFSLQIKLNCHMKTKHGIEPKDVLCERQKVVVCDFCFSEFEDQVSMEAHRNTHLRFQSFYGCIYCPRKYNTVTAFKKHKNHHLQRLFLDNPLRCEHCNETFIPFYEYLAHLREVHNAEPEMMIPQQESPVEKCPICGKEFNHMHNHIRFHEKYRCKKCLEYFYSTSSFAAHECTIESDDEALKERLSAAQEECGFCFRPFGNRKQAHLANHTKAAFIACRLCPRRFNSPELFNQHAFSHRNRSYKTKPLKCRHCPETFVKYPHYIKHNKVVHMKKEVLNYRPILPREICIICDREFPNLANHYRYHLMFKCAKCSVYILSKKLFETHECDRLPEDTNTWRKSDADLEQIIKEYSVRVYEEFILSDKPVDSQEKQANDVDAVSEIQDLNTINIYEQNDLHTSIEIHEHDLDDCLLNENADDENNIEVSLLRSTLNDTANSASDDTFKPIISGTVSLCNLVTTSIDKDTMDDDTIEIDGDDEDDVNAQNVTGETVNIKKVEEIESLNDILDTVMRMSSENL